MITTPNPSVIRGELRITYRAPRTKRIRVFEDAKLRTR
jgi:hypothetical protein